MFAVYLLQFGFVRLIDFLYGVNAFLYDFLREFDSFLSIFLCLFGGFVCLVYALNPYVNTNVGVYLIEVLEHLLEPLEFLCRFLNFSLRSLPKLPPPVVSLQLSDTRLYVLYRSLGVVYLLLYEFSFLFE